MSGLWVKRSCQKSCPLSVQCGFPSEMCPSHLQGTQTWPVNPGRFGTGPCHSLSETNYVLVTEQPAKKLAIRHQTAVRNKSWLFTPARGFDGLSRWQARNSNDRPSHCALHRQCTWAWRQYAEGRIIKIINLWTRRASRQKENILEFPNTLVYLFDLCGQRSS